MRVFVKRPTDKIEEFKKAREIKQALQEYGFSYTGTAGADYFDVRLGDASPEAVSGFLQNLEARGVSIQKGDAEALIPRDGHAIGRDIARRAVEARIQSAPHEGEMLPVDSLGEVVSEWCDSATAPAEISAADYAAIAKDLDAYEPEGFMNQISQEHRGFLESGFDSDDPAYQMNEEDLRARADAEMRGRR